MKTEYKYERIMIIDDSELDIFIAKKNMAEANFSEKIYINTSAQSALEFLINIKKACFDIHQIFPKVIFLDLNMPIMDGFQFIDYYKALTSGQAIKSKLVILTSSTIQEDEYKAKAKVPDIIFLRKPLNPQMLSEL